ncbi:MAG TPA: metallopeptidase TldD-related protein [Anaerolineae bacterium]|nr:metallopeptidase TldD-related protein [Anaerolineae bacterium]HOQ98334.1 metallopeptidase TldD-related protein [Anaerolineae bacterium]HPL29338.1 metallopeptidase TldD-related protein [Anaerolineae bacterium]
MHDHLLQTLGHTSGVHDWRLRRVVTASTQYYLAGREPENERSVNSERFEVEVYNDHPAAQGGEMRRGSAAVTLLPGDEARIDARIRQAVFMAGLTDNPPFDLPGPAVYPQVLTADRLLEAEPARVARDLAGRLLEAVAHEPGISLASAEFFVDRHEMELENSRGVNGREARTSLLVDFVLLARDEAGHETESHVEVRRRALQGVDLPELVRRQAQYARDTLRAGEPETGRFPVIISGDALHQLLGGSFMSPLAFRSSARFKYEGVSRWELGASVYDGATPTGDPLTVYANAILPWGLGSGAFDEDGVPGARLQVIEHGVLRSFWAPQRYAQYLQVPPTGAFGNLEVLPGSLAVADMWQGVGLLYHVVAFSSMMPDPVTGNFVGEIRLGYERRGHEVRPIKGGSLSGNLFVGLAHARLSQETVMLGDYLGPQAVRFPELTVSGR